MKGYEMYKLSIIVPIYGVEKYLCKCLDSIYSQADERCQVILVDDVVDSRWTLTACGHYLCEGGCVEVYPFALADSSQKED